MHSKLKLFILGFVFLCLSILSPSYSEELVFAQVSDVHYSLDDASMGKYLYFLTSSISKKNPDFAVFLGDNVKKSREEDVIGFMQSIYSLHIPYYIVLGNRDAHRISGIEKEVYLDIVTTFNHNQKENQKYYSFKSNSDFICVVLDATPDFAPSKHGQISDEQLNWLDALLTKYPKKMFLIFHHCPLLPPRIEYQRSMLTPERYQKIIDKHSNVVLISSGHYYQDSVTTDEKGIRHISAPSFKDMPYSYQLVKVIYDPRKHKSAKDVEVIVDRVKI